MLGFYRNCYVIRSKDYFPNITIVSVEKKIDFCFWMSLLMKLSLIFPVLFIFEKGVYSEWRTRKELIK